MRKLIIVPQFQARMRYQEWWPGEWERHLSGNYNVVFLGSPFDSVESKEGQFSPIKGAVELELRQIKEYLSMPLSRDDILLVCDISFPGVFPSALFLRPHENSYAICHATSINQSDLFEFMAHKGKWTVESGHSRLFKKVIVATEYHKQKLGWDNIEVLALPAPPFRIQEHEKKRDVISVARNSRQKRTKYLEDYLKFRMEIEIETGKFRTWGSYYKFISESRVMLITGTEETFGYQVLDAVINDCVPVAPNGCSYPELLPPSHLYRTKEEMVKIVTRALNEELGVPRLLNQPKIDNFFERMEEILV